jgi:hypothetical protein
VAAPLILAKTMQDAHTFAQGTLGLDKGHYRVVTSPSSISGRRGADLYLVPGYENRHDRFAMKGALKYSRLNIITPEQAEAPAPAVPDGLTPAGEQISIEEVNAFLMALGHPDPDIKELVEKQPEQAEEPARRTRRRRCPDCGDLVEPEDIAQHVADHLPQGE